MIISIFVMTYRSTYYSAVEEIFLVKNKSGRIGLYFYTAVSYNANGLNVTTLSQNGMNAPIYIF